MILENCRTINENSFSITAEIDSEEFRYLLEDITDNSFTKIIGKTRTETKNQVIGNLFLKLIIHK